ncbi:SUMF1/EgtB/PvdO family nonheme iron enzyme [Haliangium sp.]|uniref:SUMF1/EgtB/PvdO family nonheme iron enzyme n=1 Tax=Haliangium sp. TaxID=2663208 RepID=UPI003D11E878
MSQNGKNALVDLLLSMFDGSSLRRFLRRLPDGDKVSVGLPGGTASLADLVFEAVDILERYGRLDDTLFNELEKEFRGRRDDIARVRAMFAPPAPTSTPTPSYDPHLPDYAAWARRNFEHVPMLGLAGVDLALTMDELWVSLRFGVPDPGDAAGKHGLGGEPDGHGSVELDKAFARAAQRGCRHLFVYGEPGMGKTMALKKMLWSLLSEHGTSGFDGSALGLPPETVPVFLRLRDLTGPDRDQGDFGDVLDHELSAMTRSEVRPDPFGGESTPLAPAVPEGFGRWLWQRGNLLILLDGLDEIAGDDARREVCRYIEEVAKDGQQRGVRVVASSRTSGFEREGRINLNPRHFLHLRVEPMGDEQIDTLVRQWYAAADQARARMRGKQAPDDSWRFDQAQRLLDALRTQTAAKLKELSSTPLLLTLMCIVVARGERVPDRRGDFFAKCLDVLLESWVDERSRPRVLWRDEALDMLEDVAWALHTQGRKYDLRRHELEELLEPKIYKIQDRGPERRGVVFESVLRWLHRQTGVLAEYEQRHYGFCHLSLQEYQAAAYVGRRREIDTLAEHFGEPFWREVVLLFVARRDSSAAFGPLMRAVLASEGLIGPDAQRRERIQDLLYECLLEAYEADVTPFVEVAQNPNLPIERRQAALYAVRDQHDDQVLAAASVVATEVPAAPEALRLMAEQIEAEARRIRRSIALVDDAADVLLVCAPEDTATASAMAERMQGWQWRAEVATELRVADQPWRRARTIVAMAGPEGRGPWRDAETRRSLVELSRRERPVGEAQQGGVALVTALVEGAEEQALPSFLQRVPSSAVGADLASSSLPSALAELLGVTVPEAGRSIEAVEPARVFVEPATEMRFLWVPGGTFWMGSGDEDEQAYEDEKPAHQVQVAPFWLAETPATNRQYEQFLRARPGTAEPRFWRDRQYNQPEQPVVGVSWQKAMAFCQWLAEISGRPMELPTEAQWEFAARGEDGRLYPWGSERPDESRAYYGNHPIRDAALPVGSRPAGRGPYGHLDLAGNVWEWCHEVSSTDGSQRPCRGGAFDADARLLRAAARGVERTHGWSRDLGFRVAVRP